MRARRHEEPASRVDHDDPKVASVIAAVRIMANELDRPVSVHDYIHFRKTRPEAVGGLPAMTTVYRIFKAWPNVMSEAGIEREDDSPKRIPEEAMIAAMQAAARALQVTVLSSHVYDDYREQCGEKIPSSSVIRKRLGPWEQAVRRAGLEAPQRAIQRRISPAQCLSALQRASRSTSGELSVEFYERFLGEAADEELPEVSQILGIFPSWEAALSAADIDRSDDLHPETLWTVEEARRMVSLVRQMVGEEFSPERYEQIRRQATRPMPSWTTVSQLLDSDFPDD